MDGVRAGIPGATGDLRGLDDPDDFRVLGVRLGVEDVDTQRAQAGHDQIPALDVGMRHIRAQARTARVPAEMMQLVADPGHFDATDDLPVGR